MVRPNLFDERFDYDPDDMAGYRSGQIRVGAAAGGTELAVRLYELPQGESLCPYHYEYVEEWLVVLSGRPTIRDPDGEQPAEPGDAICFPAGPSGAHKVTNNGSEPARLIMFSSGREPSVAVY